MTIPIAHVRPDFRASWIGTWRTRIGLPKNEEGENHRDARAREEYSSAIPQGNPRAFKSRGSK